LLVSIEGDVATAKTTFALTAPLPIVCFSFDIGTEYAIQGLKYKDYFEGLNICTVKYNRINPKDNTVDADKHQALWQQNDITIYELPQPIQLDNTRVTGYIALWNYFISLFGMAASNPNVNSIVLDTATIARTVKVNAYLEELNEREGRVARKQLLQLEYGHPNGAIENLYSVMGTIGKTFIATHHIRDQYIPMMIKGEQEMVPSGKMELDGWNKTHRFVDVALLATKDNKATMRMQYIKCRLNPKLEGQYVIGEPNWNNLVEQISGSLGGRVSFPKRKLVND